MRYGSSSRRTRGNNGGSNNNSNRGNGGNQRRGGGVQNKNRVFDSNGPEVRIRGTAYQIVEKYMALAKDSNSAGDRVLAESYLQYAEHYQRLINSWEGENDTSDAYDNSAYDRYSRNVATEQQTTDAAEDDLSLPTSILGKPTTDTSKQENKEMANA